MKLTSNYSLKKPDGSDVVNVQDFNDNSDKIDLELKKVDSSLKEIANKVDNIKIADGTTTTKGIVKLNNATNSTSQAEAATPLAVKTAMDKANEAFQYASNGKNYIAPKVGNVTGNNTFTEIGDRIQTDKNTAATNLSNKGVSANGNEALSSLVSKIGNISNIKSASGISTVVGNIPYFSYESGGEYIGYTRGITNLGLAFIPKIVIITYSGYGPKRIIAINKEITGESYHNAFIFPQKANMSNTYLYRISFKDISQIPTMESIGATLNWSAFGW
ncbi:MULTISPECIES: tail fiber protein [unclassified Clostridium]|uniref:tail fiber protein n=1 Tax=unclassified Clostridium TaxID=2614128 RepID=UPI002079D0EE|nr:MULTISPECIES: tail fiber protein [unclassified Clostridium]